MTAKASTASLPALELAAILREFPTFENAEMLLDYFTKTIDASYRMLHIPTTWQSLRDFYTDLKHGSVYASKNGFQFATVVLQGYSQKVLAERWVKQAVILLTTPPVPPSVLALQTCMNLAHLCTQIEGLSGSFGILSVTGLQMARSMKIHQLDSAPYREQRRKHGADMIDLEVKRRIWWHMVASDWLLSYVPGPNEGTYTLHPRQMDIAHPSNIEDSNIPGGTTQVSEESYSLPLSSPTSMIYTLCRIQVATLAREVVDCLPPSFFASPGTECCDEIYDKIIALDQRYQQFLQSLPPFFQLTIQDHMSYQALLVEKPYLEWQRYLINFVVHTQLARLHRPFLIRGSMQRKYAHSRKQCISSAETVIEIRNHAMSNHSVGAFTFVLQHFLMAAIILAMDVCFNPGNTKIPLPQRKQYVLQACRALEVELNAKTIPANGAAGESTSNSQLMFRSFRRAVQNLRGLLRKRMSEDDAGSAATTEALAQDESISCGKRPGMAYPAAADETPSGNIVVNQASQPTAQSSGSEKPTEASYHPYLAQQPQTPTTRPPHDEQVSRELEERHGPGGLIVDEFWDEFFTAGSTFNDADWDMFLLDTGEQIGGIR
ncbi:fungal specific transcription factor domain-containing protein [Aspergillus foveolatus]|uniref:fungal specific transcription factor domain-containing protein n=1 Tax=Aspergillus foveolatus TaxID=210207 RepID=UPI003CCDC174